MTFENPFETLSFENRLQLWQASAEGELRYTPQVYQERFHREMQYDIKAVGGGVGAAKTFTIVKDYAHELLVAPVRAQMGMVDPSGYTGRIAITGATYDAPQVAFNYLFQTWDALDAVADVSRPKGRAWSMVSKTGVEVLCISANDPMTFAARPYTVVHLTEAMQQPIEMLDAAVERVARWPRGANGEKFFGKIYMEGTFEYSGYSWYPDRCRAWAITPNTENAKFYSFPSWENRVNFPDGFEDKSIQRLLKHYKAQGQEQKFWERVGGQPPKTEGDLWGAFLVPDKYVQAVEYDPDIPVDFCFDPGYHRYAGLFIQRPDEKTVVVLDELVIRNAEFNEYRKQFLKAPYVKVRGGKIANIGRVVCDIAAKQRQQGLDSTYAMWRTPIEQGGLGLNPEYRYLHLDTGIQVLQTALLGEYYDLIIHPRCEELLTDLREERLDSHGILDTVKNKGKDDARKALSYYLATVKGTGLSKKERARRKVFQTYGAIRKAVKGGDFSRHPKKLGDL
jgi:hypothetical protein